MSNTTTSSSSEAASSATKVSLNVKQVPLVPSDWAYKCEGIGNIVLSYVGQEPVLRGKVLRLRKELDFEDAIFTKTTAKEAREMENSKQAFVHLYLKHVMRALLGDQFIEHGELIAVNETFLKQVEELINPVRPKHRLSTKIDKENSEALLMMDLTHLAKPTATTEKKSLHTCCVELKPKWGVLCLSKYISEKTSAAKKTTCRYCMHQYQKSKKNQIHMLSEFCPLDLFSTSKKKVTGALQSLVDNPQNNMKVFLDGNLLWTGDKKKGQQVKQEELNYRQQLEELLKNYVFPSLGEVSTASTSSPQELTQYFVSIIEEILLSSKVLQVIQRVQLLDSLDIEIIEKIYKQLLTKYSDEEIHNKMFDVFQFEAAATVPKEESKTWLHILAEDVKLIESREFTCKHKNQLAEHNHQGLDPAIKSTIHASSLEEVLEQCKKDEDVALHILRSFLIAAAAKDCSVMIAFASHPEEHASLENQHTLHSGYVTVPHFGKFYFRVAIVDLDPKPVAKIPYYYDLDADIVNTYMKAVPEK